MTVVLFKLISFLEDCPAARARPASSQRVPSALPHEPACQHLPRAGVLHSPGADAAADAHMTALIKAGQHVLLLLGHSGASAPTRQLARAAAAVSPPHAHTRTRAHTRVRLRTHARTLAHTRAYACAHTRTHAHTSSLPIASRGSCARTDLPAHLRARAGSIRHHRQLTTSSRPPLSEPRAPHRRDRPLRLSGGVHRGRAAAAAGPNGESGEHGQAAQAGSL
jgi:hypothetical protein